MGRKRADRGPQGAAEADLVTAIAHFRHDPLGFVMFTWDWGQGELAGETGPDKWQIRVLHALGEASRKGEKEMAAAVRIAVASGHGVGKHLKYNEKIYTPSGWVEIGSLKVGDRVLSGAGKACSVTGIFPQGRQPLYRVRFSDGSSVLAGGPHRWAAKTKADRDRGKDWRVVTTDDLRKGLGRNWHIPMAGAAEFTARPVPIDPYIMGYFIGNGTARTASAVRISCHDEGVYERINARLPAGYGMHGSSKDGRYKHISRPTGNFDGTPNPVYAALKGYGLADVKSPEKFVPDDYLFNSPEVRLELLRGLMDSDGCISPRAGRENGFRCVFSTSSEKLRDQMIWLVQSFGGVAGFSVDDRVGEVRGGIETREVNYQVSVNLPNSIVPFSIPRKVDLYQRWLETTKQEPFRKVVSVDMEQEDEAYCISVDDPNHLYLADGFIVTHNTTLICWIICWFISTRSDPQIVVTANTATQLETKTWRELAKWWRLAINQSWFQWTATKFYLKDRPETHFAAAIPWSPQRAQSFAGTHEKKGVLILFDEASTIDDIIWETIEGAFTTAGAFFLAFGNPTQNTGRFRECWTRFKKRWLTFQVDSREAKVANQEQIKQWIEDYTEDSDFVRVRVKGMFPRASSTQFISTEEVETAQKRQEVIVGNMPTWMAFPIVVGVDVARYGDDQSVILVRQGPKIHRIRRFEGLDTVQVTYRVIETVKEIQEELDATVEGIFVDEGGVGAGVIDPLIAQGYDQAYGVQFGSKALDNKTYFNRVAEMWWDMRKAIRKDLMLPAPETTEGKDLQNDLIGRQYGFDGPGRIQLESKEDMKKRGQSSPDIADALALTYAAPVIARETETSIQKKLALIAHGMDDGGTSHMAY